MLIHTILANLTLHAENWAICIIFGALAGFIAGRLMGGGWGFLGDILLGLIGAALGWFVFGSFISGTQVWWETALIATIGAVIVLSLSRAITGTAYDPINSPLASPNPTISQAAAPARRQPAYAAPSLLQPTAAIASIPIFVSHSHSDNAWCRVFVDALKGNGCDVWYDEQGLGGVIWQKQIVQQLQSRPLFVVVLSPDATASQWVDEEIQLAISSRRKIIPVHHRQTTIEGFLTNRQIGDVRGMDGAQAATIVAQAARQLIAV